MEKILVFQSTETEKIKNIAAPLHIKVEEIAPVRFRETIGVLAGTVKAKEEQPFLGSLPEGSLMVFCQVTEEHFDKILAAMKKNKIPMTYKAVMTPTNAKWNVLRLYLEMETEKRAYEQLGK